jgi:four helix bundle protein
VPRFDNDVVDRTFAMALRVVRLGRELVKDPVGRILANQVVRSATSVGANIEEAQAAGTRREFARCMTIAKKEARETMYWLRLIAKSELLEEKLLAPLIGECEQILRILYAIVRSTATKPDAPKRRTSQLRTWNSKLALGT